MTALNLNRPRQAWLDLKAHALLFWQARSEQERKLLALGSVVVALALVWATSIAPAIEGRAQLQKSLPQLRQQAAQLQALAAQAAALSGQAPVLASQMSSASLTASLAARSLTARSLGVTGEYAKLELRGVPFGAVTGWLAQVRQESRITVEDANIVAQATPGLVDATLTLHQSADAVR